MQTIEHFIMAHMSYHGNLLNFEYFNLISWILIKLSTRGESLVICVQQWWVKLTRNFLKSQ